MVTEERSTTVTPGARPVLSVAMPPTRPFPALLAAAAVLVAASGARSAAAASWQPPFTLATGTAGTGAPGPPALGLSAAGAGIAAWQTETPARSNRLAVATRDAGAPFAAATRIRGPLGDPLAALAGPGGARAVIAPKLGPGGAIVGLAVRTWRGGTARPAGFSAGGVPAAVHAGFTTGGMLVVSWFDRSRRAIRLVAGRPDGTYTKPIVIAAFARASEGSDYGLAIGRRATVVWLSNGARQATLISSTISPAGTVSAFAVLGQVPRTTTGIVAADALDAPDLLVGWRAGASIVVSDGSGSQRTTLAAGGAVSAGPYLAATRSGRGIVAWTTAKGSELTVARIAGGSATRRTLVRPAASGARIAGVVVRASPGGRAVVAWREAGAGGAARAIVGSRALAHPHLLATGTIGGIDAGIAADGGAAVIWSERGPGTTGSAVRLAFDAAAGPAVTPPAPRAGPPLHLVPPPGIPPLP